MSIEVLTQEIMNKADYRKNELENEYDEKISTLKFESNERIENFKSKLLNSYDRDISSAERKVLGLAKKKAKTLLLETKSIIINEVFNDVLNDLIICYGKQRDELLNKLLKYSDVSFEYEVIICNKIDVSFFEKKFKSKKIVGDKNYHGIKYISKDETKLVDMSFENFLKEIFENIEDKIQDELFDI